MRGECEQRAAKPEQKLAAVETTLAEVEAQLRYGQVEALVEHQQATAEPPELERRLVDVDEQIERWRRTLADLEHRESSVRTRRAQLHPHDGAAGLPLADQRTQCGVVRRLATDLERELARLAHAPQSSRCVCRDAHVRLRPIVESLDKQIALLDQAVVEHEQAVEYRDLQGEANHLARSRAELRGQLEHLLDRREALLRSARPTRSSTSSPWPAARA